ncbi:MAG TPA: hypothetical protein VMZ03_07595 [Chitinophagaceae bacterium]|nr:hypothetical protein [Chitinophagaceae bacterium]
MLAQETQKFTQLTTDGNTTPQYEVSKDIIRNIQAVIAFRKSQSTTDTIVQFTPPDTTG